MGDKKMWEREKAGRDLWNFLRKQLSQHQGKITSIAQVKQTFKPLQDVKKSARQLPNCSSPVNKKNFFFQEILEVGVVYRGVLPPQLRGSRVDLCHFQWWGTASICQVLSVYFPSGLLQGRQNPGLKGCNPTRPSILAGGKHVPNGLGESRFLPGMTEDPGGKQPCRTGFWHPWFGLLISFQHHFTSAALTALEPVLWPKDWVKRIWNPATWQPQPFINLC